MPLLQLGPPQGKVAPSRTTYPATSLKDPCPHCKPTQGQRAALGHVLGRAEREGKHSVVSQWGKQAGGRLPLRKLRGAPQNPTLKQRGPPRCSFKMEGPETPPSGTAVAKARRQPSRPRASAERGKNSLPARAEDPGCSQGLESAAGGGGTGGGGDTCSRGPASSACPLHPAGRPGQAQLPPGQPRRAPQGSEGRGQRPCWECG